jgi:hypothetical protein
MLNQQNLSEQQRLFGRKLYQLLLYYADKKLWVKHEALAAVVGSALLEAALTRLSQSDVKRVTKARDIGEQRMKAWKWIRRHEHTLETTDDKYRRRDARNGIKTQLAKLKDLGAEGMSYADTEFEYMTAGAMLYRHQQSGTIAEMFQNHLSDLFGPACVEQVKRAFHNYRGKRLKGFPGDKFDLQELKSEQTFLINLRDALQNPKFMKGERGRTNERLEAPWFVGQVCLKHEDTVYDSEEETKRAYEELLRWIRRNTSSPIFHALDFIEFQIEQTKIWWPTDKRKSRFRSRIVTEDDPPPEFVDETQDFYSDRRSLPQRARSKIEYQPNWWRNIDPSTFITDADSRSRLCPESDYNKWKTDPQYTREAQERAGSRSPFYWDWHPPLPIYATDSSLAADLSARQRDPDIKDDDEESNLGSSFTFEGVHAYNPKLRSMWWSRDRHDDDVGEKDLNTFWLRDRYQSPPPHPLLGDKPVRNSVLYGDRDFEEAEIDEVELDLDKSGERQEEVPNDERTGLPPG